MNDRRTNQMLPLAELIPQQLTTSSIGGKITAMHQKIAVAKTQTTQKLTPAELDRIMLQVCVECGIKDTGIASEEVVDLCFKSWEELFEAKMNVHELRLAFEMNVNGELEMPVGNAIEPRVNHYQCFSREFFCEVCRRYLIKKTEANKRIPTVVAENTPALGAVSNDLLLMEALINDRQDICKMSPLPVHSKLEMLNQMFDFEVTEKQIDNYRKVAIGKLITEAAKERAVAKANNRFGEDVNATHRITRLNKGPLTPKDEADIQFEVLQLIYGNVIMLWTEIEFVKHVEDCIKQYKANG